MTLEGGVLDAHPAPGAAFSQCDHELEQRAAHGVGDFVGLGLEAGALDEAAQRF